MKYDYKMDERTSTADQPYICLVENHSKKVINTTQMHSDRRTPRNSFRNFVEYIRAGGLIEGLDD